MIRIYVQPNAQTGRYTVTMKDGNSAILVSSTSQGYERLARAEKIARRLAPRGDEPVELVIRDKHGRDVRREWLWTTYDVGRFMDTQAHLKQQAAVNAVAAAERRLAQARQKAARR